MKPSSWMNSRAWMTFLMMFLVHLTLLFFCSVVIRKELVLMYDVKSPPQTYSMRMMCSLAWKKV